MELNKMGQFEDLVDELKKVSLTGKPIIFISYDTDELALADFVRDVLNRWTQNKLDVFIAKRGILPGQNPYEVMMEEKLKHAQAVIPICSIKSKTSPWIWWESAAVWARDQKVYPLFTNIAAGGFGPPLTVVSQGKEYFINEEFIETLKQVSEQFKIDVKVVDLNKEEMDKYIKLKEEYSKLETSVKISVNCKILETVGKRRKYSLVFTVENKTKKKLEDVVVELLFPINCIDLTELQSSPFQVLSSPSDQPEYLCLAGSFLGLNEEMKKIFTTGLLPGKSLKVFGDDGMSPFHYTVGEEQWREWFTSEVKWKVYVNGGAPQEGSIPLNTIQFS